MKLPKLTLRDLFWVVALVTMGCGWWVERNRLAADRSRFADLLEIAIWKIEMLNASEETLRYLHAETEPSADGP